MTQPMRSPARVATALAAALVFGSPAQSMRAAAQEASPPSTTGPVSVVEFIDTMPAKAPNALAVLRRYRDETGSPRASRIDVFQEIGNSNRIMLLEAWHDQGSYEARRTAPDAGRLEADLRPIVRAEVDVRVHRAFVGGENPAPPAPGTEAIVVMTHLDVVPPFFAALQGPLRAYVAAVRGQAGVVSFDVLQHDPPRQNHLTILEVWRSRADLDVARDGAAARSFRDATLPLLGALYDERTYRQVR